jgi:hypothetical protein
VELGHLTYFVAVTIFLLVPAVAMSQGAPQTPASCERLASLSLPNTTITAAEMVRAGAFVVPAMRHAKEADRPHSPARSVRFPMCPAE